MKNLISWLLSILLFSFFCSCANIVDMKEQSAPETPLREEKNEQTTDGYETEITIESNDIIGAYTVEVEYDNKIINIESVDPADFPSAPLSSKRSFSTGKTKILSFTNSNTKSGAVRIAVVRFKPVSKGASLIKANLINLYNIDGIPINGTISLSTNKITVNE